MGLSPNTVFSIKFQIFYSKEYSATDPLYKKGGDAMITIIIVFLFLISVLKNFSFSCIFLIFLFIVFALFLFIFCKTMSHLNKLQKNNEKEDALW